MEVEEFHQKNRSRFQGVEEHNDKNQSEGRDLGRRLHRLNQDNYTGHGRLMETAKNLIANFDEELEDKIALRP